jgi:hypothetical protein
VRNQTPVDVSRYYGVTIATCVPADPESKGGSEATVRVAKADLQPSPACGHPPATGGVVGAGAALSASRP